MDDESGESMEPMEEVPLIQLGEAEVIVIIWHTVLLVDFNAVEFFNGHNTDKAHPFIEDCIAKQQPLVKVTTVCDLPCLPCSLLHIQPLYHTSGCLLVV